MGNMTGVKTTPAHPERPPCSPVVTVSPPPNFVKGFDCTRREPTASPPPCPPSKLSSRASRTLPSSCPEEALRLGGREDRFLKACRQHRSPHLANPQADPLNHVHSGKEARCDLVPANGHFAELSVFIKKNPTNAIVPITVAIGKPTFPTPVFPCGTGVYSFSGLTLMLYFSPFPSSL
jgi:hypothetical protein